MSGAAVSSDGTAHGNQTPTLVSPAPGHIGRGKGGRRSQELGAMLRHGIAIAGIIGRRKGRQRAGALAARAGARGGRAAGAARRGRRAFPGRVGPGPPVVEPEPQARDPGRHERGRPGHQRGALRAFDWWKGELVWSAGFVKPGRRSSVLCNRPCQVIDECLSRELSRSPAAFSAMMERKLAHAGNQMREH